MNYLPLSAHGTTDVIKITKQALNDKAKVLEKVKLALSKDVSFVPMFGKEGWCLLDANKYLKCQDVTMSTAKAKIMNNEDKFVDLLSSLVDDSLVLIIDVEHKDKILAVINKYDIVKNKTIHAHLYLLLINMEIKLRLFYSTQTALLETKMNEMHPTNYNEIVKNVGIEKTRGRETRPVDYIGVQYLAEIYVRYNHPVLGRQREQISREIYDLRTNLVHMNASNLDNIDVTGKVIQTVTYMVQIIEHLESN